MATMTRRGTGTTILRRISYRTYVGIRDEPANRHLRMTYHDGTLEIMSPELIHESPAERLGMIVRAVTCVLKLPCIGTGSTTFRRGGQGIYKGKGKEPDRSYYITNAAFLRAKKPKTVDLDAGEPPPDLWIEVDNRSTSRGSLPIYATLGIPEVWRFRARREALEFVALNDGAYEKVERSICLPMLSPSLVLEALELGVGLYESDWDDLLRDWVREKLGPQGEEVR